MTHLTTYCLEHRKPKCNCKGSLKFRYSSKLRPPENTGNKVKFRKFLEECPTFVNCVPDELKEEFLGLLREVKAFNMTINGRQWTNISK